MATPTTRTITELAKIHVTEVSGVDEPANLTPGWLMQKSANIGAVVDAAIAEAVAAGAAELAKALPPRHPDGSGRFHRPTGSGPSLRDVRDVLGSGAFGGEGSSPKSAVHKSETGLFTWHAGQSGTTNGTGRRYQ